MKTDDIDCALFVQLTESKRLNNCEYILAKSHTRNNKGLYKKLKQFYEKSQCTPDIYFF